jgi:DNA-binding LacI/PurR family transcriptional regulator
MSLKYQQAAAVIASRLQSGDYVLAGLPGERQLALELGISHMTARRAVQHLISQGVLPRRPVGRLAGRESRIRPSCHLLIGLVAPAFESASLLRWRSALERVVAERQGSVRFIGYTSETDRAITDALDGHFDGLFIVPPFALSPLLIDRLRDVRHRAVTLFHDFTHLGLPCVDLGAPRFIGRIAGHFAELGHRRVDCLNTEPLNPLIEQRMRCWAEACQGAGLETRVHNRAVRPFEHADVRAAEVAGELFDSGALRGATGLFCTSTGSTRGIYRAAYERGIGIGTHLSLASCDSLQEARLMTPSLTTLHNPDVSPFLTRGLEWIQTGGQGWDGSLKIQPDDVPLWAGESTRPAPAAGNTHPLLEDRR